MSKILKRTGADYLITDTGQTVPADSQLTIDPANYSLYARSNDVITALASGDLTYNDGSSDLDLTSAMDHIKGINPKTIDVNSEPPFAAKKILINGVLKSLFKRVHGCTSYYIDNTDPQNPVTQNSIPAGQTGYIELAIPYAQCKFTAAEIVDVAKGDTLSFYILDTATNTYSGAPVETYGANFPLNQFGFDVRMPTAPKYKDTSAYDADLYQGMIVMCAYKNNGASARIVDMNVTLHEVK